MVTSDVNKVATTCLLVIGNCLIPFLYRQVITICSTDSSKYKSWKVLETVASLLNVHIEDLRYPYNTEINSQYRFKIQNNKKKLFS